MEKEKWKDEVMDSLHGMQRSEPNSFLFTRIEARLKEVSGLANWQIRLAGMCMVLIVAVNIWMVRLNTISTENTNSLTTTYRY